MRCAVLARPDGTSMTANTSESASRQWAAGSLCFVRRLIRSVLLIAHGTTEGVAKAKSIIDKTCAAESAVYHG